MRFLITAAPDPDAPKTDRPLADDSFAAYMRFNEEMHQAGVLVAAEGLNATGRGARIVTTKGRRTVLDGPYAESKELVGGFYLISRCRRWTRRSGGRFAARSGSDPTTSSRSTR
jgi:hypothetical protein